VARAIYKITNTVNGKFYVGSSVDTRRRFWAHKKLLRRGTHHCHYLQNAWNKHGEDTFNFDVIEIVPEHESLETVEDRWLEEHFGQKYCYNIGRSAKAPWRGVFGADHPMHGSVISDEHKQKISKGVNSRYEDPNYQPRRGKKHSKESRALISEKVQKAISEGRGGCFIPGVETRQKMSISLKGNICAKGYKRTDAEKETIRQRMLGNQNFLGKHHTDETRAKMGKRLIELTTGKEFAVMNDAVKFYGMPNLATILRSIERNAPVSKGPNSGLIFSYGDNPAQLPAESEYPMSRKQAIEQGATHYSTGRPCKRGHMALRLTKGACVVCRKEDWTTENERRKQKKSNAVCV
jgi:group I intron endonuclease